MKGATKILIELPRNQFTLTTYELMRPPSRSDIARVPVLGEHFKDKAGNLSVEQLEKLVHP